MRNWRVPRNEVHAVHRMMKEQLSASLSSILFDPHSFEHEMLQPLEHAFAAVMERSYAVSVNSATSGLFLALLACGVKSGDEVITVGNSDISTTAAISHCGAQPILCDVLEKDFTIDPQKVKDLISDRTRAILPVDLYGHPANVKALRNIADAHNLRIIEDAALATGSYDYGKPVGAFADAAVFSFGVNKPLGSVGNGGIVVTDDADIFEKLRLYRGYGRHPDDTTYKTDGRLIHIVEGYNLPLDPLQSAIVLEKLPRLQTWTSARRAVVNSYGRQLENLDIHLPAFRSESKPTFYCYTIRVTQRDRVYTELRNQGIEVSCYYVPPVYSQPAYQEWSFNVMNVTNTTRLSKELLCLPVHPTLSENDITYVVDALKKAL